MSFFPVLKLNQSSCICIKEFHADIFTGHLIEYLLLQIEKWMLKPSLITGFFFFCVTGRCFWRRNWQTMLKGWGRFWGASYQNFQKIKSNLSEEKDYWTPSSSMIVSTPIYLWINLRYNVMILKWKCIHVYIILISIHPLNIIVLDLSR